MSRGCKGCAACPRPLSPVRGELLVMTAMTEARKPSGSPRATFDSGMRQPASVTFSSKSKSLPNTNSAVVSRRSFRERNVTFCVQQDDEKGRPADAHGRETNFLLWRVTTPRRNADPPRSTSDQGGKQIRLASAAGCRDLWRKRERANGA